MSTRLDLTSLSAGDAEAITPSDSTVVNYSSIYVGGTGDLIVKLRSGVAVTFKSVPVGTVLNINVNRVMAATTASLLIGMMP